MSSGSGSNEAFRAASGGLNPWRKLKLGSRDLSLRVRSRDSDDPASNGGEEEGGIPGASGPVPTQYRTYRRRWLGFIQLTLLNIIVSWDWLTYAPVVSQSAAYYRVSNATINWMSTVFLLAFVACAPFTIAIIHRGPKLAIVTASVLILVGNWIRYAGSSHRSGGSFAAAMFGEIIVGFAQPLVLSAPTRYSDLWFTSSGRVAATAVPSLANPVGAALAQLINPFWVTDPGDISSMTLYIAIISTVVCLPSFFVPSKPPTPVEPSSETPKLNLRESIGAVAGSLELWLLLIPFSIYVGFFNSISSLINQMMVPYGYTDNQAGIGGAILIVTGLVAAAICSPILDRTRQFLFALKLFVPMIGFSFLVFLWMPQTRTIAGPYVVLAMIGAACFALVPIALEYLSEISHPLSPEVTSTIAWSGGQLFGAIFIVVSSYALTAGKDASPPYNMDKALIFQAAISMIVMPIPLFLGAFGRKDKVALRRIQFDQTYIQEHRVEEE